MSINSCGKKATSPGPSSLVRRGKVRTLVNKKQSAGHYKITWDGKNNGNFSVANGVYIYKLTASEFLKSGKMIKIQ